MGGRHNSLADEAIDSARLSADRSAIAADKAAKEAARLNDDPSSATVSAINDSAATARAAALKAQSNIKLLGATAAPVR